MYTIADEYLRADGLDFQKLLPIIKETAHRIKTGQPKDWQTGPAKRGDSEVIAKHLTMIPDPEVQAIYKKLSQFLTNKG
jgi:hypothetical protein